MNWFTQIWQGAGDVWGSTQTPPAGYHYEWGIGYVPNSQAYSPLIMWGIVALVLVLLLRK